MITLHHVTKTYPNGHLALSHISLQILHGEMVFLEGHSGAGKSTLLKLIALLEPPTRGQIIVNGQNIHHFSSGDVPYYRRRLGFISQHPKLLQNCTIFENVALPLVVAGYDSLETRRRTHAALDRVGLLSKEKCFPFTLSDGEQQRVGIARAVVHKPNYLIADEPTGNLDPELSFEIMKLFERFHQVGVTVLIASHDKALIDRFPYRRILLSKGKQVLSTKATVAEEVVDVN